MALGRGTHNLLDRPLAISSVFTPYVGDNGYSFTGLNTIYVLHNENGTLATYNEAAAADAFGTVTLAVPLEDELTLDYNQSMIKRIQSTQIMDIPVDSYVKKWVAQQLDQVFVPAHDVYSLAKLVAARPTANRVSSVIANWTGSGTGTEKLSFKIGQAITMVTDKGGDNNQMIGWVSTAFLNSLKSEISFTGSDILPSKRVCYLR